MTDVKKRIMVDMSATLIHHGHIRLLKEASKLGKVIVGLTIDEEIKAKKHFEPEMDFNSRKEILESIKYVSEVVPTPWNIDDAVMDKYLIDYLVHGSDANLSSKSRRGMTMRFMPTTSVFDHNLAKEKYNNLNVSKYSNRKIYLARGHDKSKRNNLEVVNF